MSNIATQNRSWKKDGHYVDVGPYKVVVGYNPGKTGHTDNAGSVTHKEFLKGEYQDMVRRDFGEEVLQEIISAVRGARRSFIKPNPETKVRRQEDKARLKAWKKIPVDARLARWAAEAEENAFKDNYGYGPDGTTLVTLEEGVTFQSGLGPERFDARFTFANGTTKEIHIMAMPALGHKGFLYLASNGMEIWNSKGEKVFDTGVTAQDGNMNETHGIGASYRLTNILRHGDDILVEYSNYWLDRKDVMKHLGKQGWLLVTPEEGIVSRCKNPVEK